jgi:hypothetical protein
MTRRKNLCAIVVADDMEIVEAVCSAGYHSEPVPCLHYESSREIGGCKHISQLETCRCREARRAAAAKLIVRLRKRYGVAE